MRSFALPEFSCGLKPFLFIPQIPGGKTQELSIQLIERQAASETKAI
jgi:hypothetical protein